MIPKGWAFCTADFSMQAAGKSNTGHVMFVRAPVEKEVWFRLSEYDQERIPLYISGSGRSIDAAIEDAVSKIIDLEA